MGLTQWDKPLLGDSDQRRSLWFSSVRKARQICERSTWNVLPWVTTSWSWNTLCLNIISKLFGIITRQWNCSFLCRNRLSAWTMISDLALRTWGEHLKVEMVWKIKITAHRQRIRSSVVGNTTWVKTFPFWPFLVVLHCDITVDNLLTERTKASWRQWHWTN